MPGRDAGTIDKTSLKTRIVMETITHLLLSKDIIAVAQMAVTVAVMAQLDPRRKEDSCYMLSVFVSSI
jgi:hypothetical protein